MLNAPVVEQALMARTGDARLGIGWGVMAIGVAAVWSTLWISLQRREGASIARAEASGGTATDLRDVEIESSPASGGHGDTLTAREQHQSSDAVIDRVAILFEPRGGVIAIVRSDGAHAQQRAGEPLKERPGGGA